MANAKNETVFTNVEIEEMCDQVRLVMQTDGLTMKEVSDESGVPYGTFSSWLPGKYTGDNSKVAEKVQNWLNTREEKKRELARVPDVPGFIPTPSALEFMEALQYAQIMTDMVVVAGSAGIGKTTAARQYQGKHSNVFIVEMEPATASVNPMMKTICDSLEIRERSAAELPRAIKNKLRNTGGLLIVDEAQHLSTASIDQLRSFYDQCNIGVALIGNMDVYSRLEGDGTRAGFAQLFSRVGVRISRTKPRSKDMCDLIAAWGVTDKEEIRTLKTIAARPGALRTMTKTLRLASMIAAGAGQKRDVRHLKAAFERQSPTAQTS